MLTRLSIHNFKAFAAAEIELGERVVFVGPNNAGKTTALQALALWNAGVRRWVEKRGAGNVPKERAGVTINRRDLIALPVPAANLLWHDLHVREGYREAEKTKTRNVLVRIAVEGLDHGRPWIADLEFDYANEESFYCRSRLSAEGSRKEVPATAAELRLAYLPPMSGLAANETRLDEGAIGVRVGEGRTAEVLRNLCWQAQQRSAESWQRIVARMQALFGVTLDDPQYIQARGEIGFEQYLQAQETGWVLYLEGSTDLAILRAFAAALGHAAAAALERPFVHDVANQPGQARHHYYGLRAAVPALLGIALYDRLEIDLQRDPALLQRMWKRREIENYLCQRETLLAWAAAQGERQGGEIFAHGWRDAMATSIDEVAAALATLGKPDPWSSDVKASDDFLQPLFRKFYDRLGLPNVMRKTDYHTLAPYVSAAAIDAEVGEVLDEIDRLSRRGNP